MINGTKDALLMNKDTQASKKLHHNLIFLFVYFLLVHSFSFFCNALITFKEIKISPRDMDEKLVTYIFTFFIILIVFQN